MTPTLGFIPLFPAPCIPQNLQTSSDCSSDVLLSKWDLAEGALRYTVEAYGNKGHSSRYNCSSMSNSCAIEGVHCGDFLTIYITAFDNECASPRTLGPVAETGDKSSSFFEQTILALCRAEFLICASCDILYLALRFSTSQTHFTYIESTNNSKTLVLTYMSIMNPKRLTQQV